MNKKQLIVAWVMGVALLGIIIITPKIICKDNTYYEANPQTTPIGYTYVPLTNWNAVFTHSSMVLIIGSLLIYTLRNKK